MKQLSNRLEKLNACSEAIKWVKKDRPVKADYPTDRIDYCYALETYADRLEKLTSQVCGVDAKAICNNCGCPDMEERHDHLWCDWCGNEHSRPLTLQEAMREAVNKIKLDM